MISRTLAQIAAEQTLMPILACLGLLIFVAVFVTMLLWTSRSRSASLYSEMSLMPLERESTPTESNEVRS